MFNLWVEKIPPKRGELRLIFKKFKNFQFAPKFLRIFGPHRKIFGKLSEKSRSFGPFRKLRRKFVERSIFEKFAEPEKIFRRKVRNFSKRFGRNFQFFAIANLLVIDQEIKSIFQ